MATPTLVYRHAANPSRGLAASGVFLIKAILATPHIFVVGALSSLTQVLAYIGFWVVALTGQMPSGIYQLIGISYKWSARTIGWLVGYTDLYPPFETHPPYPVDVDMEPNTEPNRGWAIAGILLPLKVLVLIPHLVGFAVVAIGAIAAMWVGYVAVLFTGEFPGALQDFIAGTMQWGLRISAFLTGITDKYPEFSLDATPHPAPPA
jgi:hypothetical protein